MCNTLLKSQLASTHHGSRQKKRKASSHRPPPSWRSRTHGGAVPRVWRLLREAETFFKLSRTSPRNSGARSSLHCMLRLCVELRAHRSSQFLHSSCSGWRCSAGVPGTPGHVRPRVCVLLLVYYYKCTCFLTFQRIAHASCSQVFYQSTVNGKLQDCPDTGPLHCRLRAIRGAPLRSCQLHLTFYCHPNISDTFFTASVILFSPKYFR